MLRYFVVGTLAAFGALSWLWAALGWLLPDGKGCALVCFGKPEPENLTRFKWLKSLGLLNCPILIVSDQGREQIPGTENCRGEDLLLRLKQERKRYDGTGNGDPSGRHQRCGISEL